MFENFPNLIATFSNRQHKNMSLFYGHSEGAQENRKKFLSELDIDYRTLVCAKQIHASAIKYAREIDLGKGAFSYLEAISNTDGLITDKKNLPLAIFTADCLSIFLYDARTPAIGLLHAGWRSTKVSIASKVVEKMHKEFGSVVKNIQVGLGPAIRSCCYTVGGDFTDIFPGSVSKKGSRYYLDLVSVNKKQLQDAGIQEKNIFDPGICTYCNNERFFSYRKEGESCGRQISVMMLK